MKDRVEKAKPTIVSLDPTGDLDENMFAQMKRLINNQSKSAITSSMAVQTDQVETFVPPKESTETYQQENLVASSIPPEIVRFIHYLLCLVNKVNEEPLFFNAIVSSFELLEDSCVLHISTPSIFKQILQNTNQLFLQLLFTKLHTLPAFEVSFYLRSNTP